MGGRNNRMLDVGPMGVLEKRVEIETHATYNVRLMGCWINGGVDPIRCRKKGVKSHNV